MLSQSSSPSPHRTCFFFTTTPTTEIYTLSLHDALPIWIRQWSGVRRGRPSKCSSCCHCRHCEQQQSRQWQDRKSTRLNSSHITISYAVFCLKKKKRNKINITY